MSNSFKNRKYVVRWMKALMLTEAVKSVDTNMLRSPKMTSPGGSTAWDGPGRVTWVLIPKLPLRSCVLLRKSGTVFSFVKWVVWTFWSPHSLSFRYLKTQRPLPCLPCQLHPLCWIFGFSHCCRAAAQTCELSLCGTWHIGYRWKIPAPKDGALNGFCNILYFA